MPAKAVSDIQGLSGFRMVAAWPTVGEPVLFALLGVLATAAGLSIWRAVRRRKNDDGQASQQAVTAYQSVLSNNFPGVLCSFRQEADGSSHLIYASENFEDVCGVPAAQVGLGPAKCFQLVNTVDAARLLPTITDAAAKLSPWFAEYRIQHPLKGEIWVEERSTPVKQENGTTIWHGVIFDITEKKRAERAKILAAERLAIATETAGLGYLDVDILSASTFGSPECKTIFGIAPDRDVALTELLELVHADDRSAFEKICTVAQPGAAARPVVSEFRILRPDGALRRVAVTSRTLQEDVDGQRRATRVISCIVDITERLQLQEDAGLWQKLFVGPNCGLAHIQLPDGEILAVSEIFASQRGYAARELRGKKITTLLPANTTEQFAALLQHIMSAGHHVWETVHQRKDGSQFPVLQEATLFAGANGEPPTMMCYALDISKFKESEIALAKSQILHQVTISSLREGVMTFDAEGRVLSCNPAAERFVGVSREEMITERPNFKAWSVISEDGDALDTSEFPAVRTLNTGLAYEGVVIGVPNLRRDRPDTSTRWLLVNSAPVNDPYGSSDRSVVVSFMDITARKEAEKRNAQLLETLKVAQAETQLQKSLFQSIFDRAPDAIIVTDLRRRVTSVNREFNRVFGYDISELSGRSTRSLFATVEDWERIGAHIDASDLKEIVVADSVQFRRKNGECFPGRISGTMLMDEQHNPLGYIALVRDISHELEHERAMEEVRRYESLGKLTSGIAHDFNNLLTVISINLQLIALAAPTQQAKRQVDTALLATSMGAKLNQRLTGLARRGVLQSIPLSLNNVVREIADVLRIAIGERCTLSLTLAPDLRLIKADPIEVENMLLNFAINSRDAMPTGGVLTIETFNGAQTASPQQQILGPVVILKVRDTGHGMPAEVLKRATERFYTTKTSGSGLGLAAVNDFVKQSGGNLSIESVEGDGTTIQVILPAYAAINADPAMTTTEAASNYVGRHRILVVEDNAAVLEAVCEYLQSLGYQVFRAPDVASALQILSSEADIDLVFTDIVLPGGLSGYDLGNEISKSHPDVKVLYASGFAEDTSDDGANGKHTLKKPYALEDLQSTISAMLASRL